MDEIERLTSYLDGALDADERRALEHELAGDADLRSRLAAIVTVDAALDEVTVAELPEGARARLDARLVGELTAAIAPLDPAAAPTTAEATGRGTDELAVRRQRRRWVPAVTGVAAAAVLAVAGVAGMLDRLPLPSLGSDDNAGVEAMESMAHDDAEVSLAPSEEAGVAAADAGPGPAATPVVIDDQRRVGGAAAEGLAEELLGRPELTDLAAQGLDPEQGAALAALAQELLLGSAGTGEVTTEGAAPESAEADGAADEADARVSAEAAPAPIVTRDGRILADDDAEDLRRCVQSLLAAGSGAVPTTVELLEVDGRPTVAVGLVTLDPTTDAFTRGEMWLLERATCQVLRFAQS